MPLPADAAGQVLTRQVGLKADLPQPRNWQDRQTIFAILYLLAEKCDKQQSLAVNNQAESASNYGVVIRERKVRTHAHIKEE
jgi:hypothetical protein